MDHLSSALAASADQKEALRVDSTAGPAESSRAEQTQRNEQIPRSEQTLRPDQTLVDRQGFKQRSLDAAESGRAAKPVWVAVGDSVTAASPYSGVTVENVYTTLARGRLAECGVDLQLVVSALDGIDSGYAVKRFNRMVTAFDPDVVTIMLGLNDARPPGNRLPASPEEYRRNLMGLVERVLAIDARPVLLTPTPRPVRATSGSWHEGRSPGASIGDPVMWPYAQVVRETADHYQLGVVDVYRRLWMLAGSPSGDLETLVPDGTHPTPEGHSAMADLLASTLAQLYGVVLSPQSLPMQPAASTESARATA